MYSSAIDAPRRAALAAIAASLAHARMAATNAVHAGAVVRTAEVTAKVGSDLSAIPTAVL